MKQCVTCQQPVTGDNSECDHCGKPVHHDPTNYRNDTVCGSWDMDWWSNGAEDENEYLCNACIKVVYGIDRSVKA
jgi:hypothetical protein